MLKLLQVQNRSVSCCFVTCIDSLQAALKIGLQPSEADNAEPDGLDFSSGV
jgi:hypothetical protein